MKCKRIIKVVSALALTVALLVSTGVVSFAATYTTTTTYKNQDTIEVTSTAYGLNAGEMATYVAYNNGSFSEANAVYIDQATADGENDVVFTYQTSSDNVKATVKFGGSTGATAETNNGVTEEGYTVYVTVNGEDAGTVVVPEVDQTETDGDGVYNSEYLAREIPVIIPDGHAVDSVSVGGTPVDVWYVKDGVVVIYSNVILADADVAITTKAVTAEVKLGAIEGVAGKLTVFAKAVCEDGVDYGIIIANGENADISNTVKFDEASDYTTAVKLPALGKGATGGFAVEVEDEKLSAGTYTVAAYAGENTVQTIFDIVQ